MRQPLPHLVLIEYTLNIRSTAIVVVLEFFVIGVCGIGWGYARGALDLFVIFHAGDLETQLRANHD